MKLLLFVLFVTFVTQVHAFFKHQISDNCQELFETDKCSQCQSTVWDKLKNFDQCSSTFTLIREMDDIIEGSNETVEPYDLKFVKKATESYCQKDFQCDQEKAEKIYNEIQDACEQELLVKLYWSENPKNYDKTIYAAYMTFIAYYNGGIPEREAVCAKSSSGDFYSYNFTKELSNWMKEETQSDPKAVLSYDIQYIFKGNGERISVPRTFFCNSNWRKMAQYEIDYIKEHKIKESIGENIYRSYDELDNLYLLQNCNNFKLKKRIIAAIAQLVLGIAGVTGIFAAAGMQG